MFILVSNIDNFVFNIPTLQIPFDAEEVNLVLNYVKHSMYQTGYFRWSELIIPFCYYKMNSSIIRFIKKKRKQIINLSSQLIKYNNFPHVFLLFYPFADVNYKNLYIIIVLGFALISNSINFLLTHVNVNKMPNCMLLSILCFFNFI